MKNDVISQALQRVAKDWNIEQMAQAVISDDPTAKVIESELKQALSEMKQGSYARVNKIPLSPIAEIRSKSGLSQRLFAERLGISVNTLKSWEQGKRQPSGSALALMKLITKKPELIAELA
ncbi:MAG: helix-turn-helix domain-containing protein [Pasteurellaceae bacterium]|nr:helix-turn-helix domain-containing protein [Pasteurellaceae bacterium]